MFAETAALIARLSLKDDFSKPLSRAQGNAKKFGSSIGKAGKVAAVGVGAAVGAAALVITRSVKAGLDSLATLEDATTSVSGAITQKGFQGVLDSGEIARWANEIEAATDAAFDDKDITQAATTLIRYGKVAPASLKETLTVMTDLAAKTGSVDSASSKLAKALADPTKASRILREVGVTLTEEQEDQVKQWVKTGKLGKAQALILAEVAKATEGAAKAMHGEYRDSQLIFQDVVEDAQRALATGFIPVLKEVRDIMSEELAKPETLGRIKEFGEGLAGGLRGAIQIARGLPWDQIGDSLKIAGAGAKAVFDALTSMPPWVQTAVLTGWGLNKLTGGAVMKIGVELVSGAAEGLFKQFFARGSSPVNPLFVSDVLGGKGGVPAAGAGAAAGGGALAGLLSTAGILAGFALVAESASKVPGAFDNFSQGLSDLSNKDIPGAQDALGDLIKGLPDLNPLVNKGFLEQLFNQIPPIPPAGATAFVDKGDSHNRAEWNKQKARDDAQRSAIEASRIAVTTAIGNQGSKGQAATDRARDRIEAARIATVSAIGTNRSGVVSGGHSDADRIVNAIKLYGQPKVVVNVRPGGPGGHGRPKVTTGQSLNRDQRTDGSIGPGGT